MSSSGESMNKDADESAGGLVWVRRRNGSWWPGRVLGIDELPERCTASPRSGTPVKLLGRDDASVDWYNLEKSKRIKPFRCGEFDACIEKVKAAVTSSKKAVKYARREDAILHAIELEGARQSKDHSNICSTIEKCSFKEYVTKDPPTTLLPVEKTDYLSEELVGFEDKSVTGLELSHSGVSFEEPNTKEHSANGTRRKTPNDSEDDETERTKRMRGLEDLGVAVESSSKRKRSEAAIVHDFLKKKGRRRQLTEVLESTAMVMVPVMCEPLASPTESSIIGVSDSKASGLECSESKGSFSMVINNNSDSSGENGTSFNVSEHSDHALLISCKWKENEVSGTSLAEGDSFNRLFDVPLVGEDLAGIYSVHVACATQKPQVSAGAGAGVHSSQDNLVETVPLIKEEIPLIKEESNESGPTSSGATNTDVNDSRIEGNSKWMLKGKRNLRNTSKSRKRVFDNSVDEDDKRVFDNSVDEDDKSNEYLSDVAGSLVSDSNCTLHIKSESITEIQGNEVQGWSTQILQKESQMKGPTAELVAPQRLLPRRQSRYVVNPKYQSSEYPLRVYDPDSNLYDVNLEVKSRYRPQHVPYISLMSKLNGQPIIGHPLTVETLDVGFCDLLIGSPEYSSGNHDLDEDEDVYGPDGMDTVQKGKPNLHNGRSSKKGNVSKPPGSTCILPKPKKNGLLSKKIRKLSSITGSHKQSVEKKKPVAQKLKGPSVACVPLKLVFSRIKAEMN